MIIGITLSIMAPLDRYTSPDSFGLNALLSLEGNR